MNNPYQNPNQLYAAPAGPPRPLPKPGTSDYNSRMMEYHQTAITQAQEQLNSAAQHIAELNTPEGQQRVVDQAVARNNAVLKQDPNALITPVDQQAVIKEADANARMVQKNAEAQLDAHMKAAQAISNGENPAVVARLNAQSQIATTNARQLYQAEAEREKNAEAGFGAVTNEQKLQNDMAMASQRINMLHQNIDLSKAMSEDELNRTFTLPRQMAIDAFNAANSQMKSEQEQQQAALTNDRSVWNTLYNGAMTEYANDYTNKVSQRNQDLQTATSLAGDAARIVGQIIPHAASNEVMNDVFGPNSTYAKMGGTPQDWTNRPTNAPSIQDMINQPLTTFNAAYAGMPGQVQMPGFTSPGSAPMAADYLHQTPSEQYISGLYGQQLPTPQVPQGSPYSGVQQQMQQTQAQMAQQPYLPPAPIPQSLNYQPQMTPEQVAAYAAMYGGNPPLPGEE